MSSEVIPKGGLVLVTGINGFIGSHIADQLLQQGYRVRGTARTQKKGDDMLLYYDEQYGKGKVEVLVVEDMASYDAFDEASKGVDGIVHVASDLSFGKDPDKVVGAVVDGTRNALKAAAKNSTVKRFVLTSSSIALVYPQRNKKLNIDSTSWNEDSVEKAWSLPEDDEWKFFHVYGASKVKGERAAWDFVKENKPGFTLNTVTPNFNIGKVLHKSQEGSSSNWMIKVYNGDPARVKQLQEFLPQYMIHVVDDALLHIAGLTQPDVQNERLLGFAHPVSYAEALEVFKKINPNLDLPAPINYDKDLISYDTRRSEELLKRYGRNGWASFEQAMRDALQQN